jgi:lipid-A-disaccharide synthase
VSEPIENKRIVLIAGEASGDLLGAALMRDLKILHPNAEFVGVGGDEMRRQGLNAWHDYHELAVMGLAEVLKHLPRLLKFRKQLRERIVQCKPDVVIGIDAPDFNLGLERWLKQRGICTVHYVSPSIWAWREKRAAKIAQSADRVLCLFPMEPAIYAKYGVKAEFVGHPLAMQFPMLTDQAAAREELKLSQSGTQLAVLPGSRISEIERLLPTFLKAADLLRKHFPDLLLLIPAANSQCSAKIEQLLAAHNTIAALVLNGQAHQAMTASNAVLLASGTAALEALLAKRLMVVGYKISPLTNAIVKLFGMLKVNRFSLPNILSQKELVTECMQSDCTAETIARAILPLLHRPQAHGDVLDMYQKIHQSLYEPSPGIAAHCISQLIQKK